MSEPKKETVEAQQRQSETAKEFAEAMGVTMFVCGPSKCSHDYSGWQEFEGGGTAVCVKCGVRAIDEAA